MWVTVLLSLAEDEVQDGSKTQGGVQVTRRQSTGP